ncbi:phage portal protein [Paenibacillus vini]|uniref:phage portal protein n=1 Tax=Paenibacillus vini TaxID=1476024 RepID=UPI0025B6D718|nr:phage portal protein [Paenibacillus vini]MDN4069252.1 phage portal protein [Paenibacillus vini]MDN4069305.1 phage portal protein [Paenibacillus vini]
MSTLGEILQNIKDNAPMTIDEIVQEEVKNWEASDERRLMLTGEKYYKVKNDVLNRKRKAIGPDGKLAEVHNLSDNRIPHGFIRKLADQKIGYLLSKPFLARTKNEAYQKILDGYFDKGFRRMLKNTGKNAINAGKAWLQVYYNEAGQLAFKLLPSQEVIPLWKDAAHTELDAAIRVYEVIEYEAKQEKTIKKIELWNSDGVRWYEGSGGEFRFVGSGEHFTAITEEDGQLKEEAMNWERVPFICFKYNDEEQPLIDLIKRQIDDYDRNISDNSNNLEDLPNSMYVVKDYDGTDAAEFRRNMSIFRVAFVNGTGGINAINLDIDTEAHKAHIEQLRKDIYEFGRGVDTQSERFGNSPSGIALKHLYADLDLDANDMETEFQASMEELLWFIDKHIFNTTKVDYSNEDVEFIFNRDIIINETEAVTNAKNSIGVISDKTILANHPWVTDVNEEEKQKKKEANAGTDDYGGLGDKAKEDPVGTAGDEE